MMQDPVIMGPFGDLSEDAMCLSCLDPLDIEVCQTCPGCGFPMCDKCLDKPSHSHRQECSLLTVLMRHTDDFMAVTLIRLLMLKYINSGLFKLLVSFVNRDKTGRNIELKNKGSLITAIVEGFNEYWSLQEIQSAIEVVESRSELVQQYTNITPAQIRMLCSDLWGYIIVKWTRTLLVPTAKIFTINLHKQFWWHWKILGEMKNYCYSPMSILWGANMETVTVRKKLHLKLVNHKY